MIPRIQKQMDDIHRRYEEELKALRVENTIFRGEEVVRT